MHEEITKHQTPVVRPFWKVLNDKISKKLTAIIAELKKASPSKGMIRSDFEPGELAKEFEKNGATCLSVLTDNEFFSGKNLDLELAKKNCKLPILRKDFVIDTYQIYESRHIGADCILLIAAILSEKQIHEFYHLAEELNLSVIIEVHDTIDLQKALKINPKIIGINNRDLKTFNVSLQTTLELAKQIPDNCIVVCESGINSKEDMDLVRSHQIYAFLIGESLMREKDPGKKLRELCSI
jgi:indole-3-glycerol phosphate synthase